MVNRNPKKRILDECSFQNFENIDDNDDNNLPLLPNHCLNPKLILSNSIERNDNKINLILDKGKELLITFDSKQDFEHITKKFCRQYHLSAEIEQALFKNIKKRAEIEKELSNPLIEMGYEKPIKFPKRKCYDKEYEQKIIMIKSKSEEKCSDQNKFCNNSALKINLKKMKKFQSPKNNISNNNKKEVFKRLYLDYQNRQNFLKALSKTKDKEEANKKKNRSLTKCKRKIEERNQNVFQNTINDLKENILEDSSERKNKSDIKNDVKSNSIYFDCFNIQIKNMNNHPLKGNRIRAKSIKKIQKIHNSSNTIPFYLVHPLYSNCNFRKLTHFTKLRSSRSPIAAKQNIKQNEIFLNNSSTISFGSPSTVLNENEKSVNMLNFENTEINNRNKLSSMKIKENNSLKKDKSKFRTFSKIIDILNPKNLSKICPKNINLKGPLHLEIPPEILIWFPKLFTELRNKNQEYNIQDFLQFAYQIFKELTFPEQENLLNRINSIETKTPIIQSPLNIKAIKYGDLNI